MVDWTSTKMPDPVPNPSPSGGGRSWSWHPDVVVELVDAVVAVSLASALARVALAEASDAWAETTVAFNVARSSEARVWPAVTVWPTVTSTVLTVPEALKFRLAWLTGVMVPTESRVDSTVPVPTTAVR